MKNSLFVLFLIFSTILYSQNRKILLEENTGTCCSYCPEGSYMVDSMEILYPNLISVSLHAFSSCDPMFFPQIDTIADVYMYYAPSAAIDRINFNIGNYVALNREYWQNAIVERLDVLAKVNITMDNSWNENNRMITSTINTDILTELDSANYRVNLYIVEDSVYVPNNPAYHQMNNYDSDISSPFHGLGNPIPGFVHKHVVRAILPNSWGNGDVIPNQAHTGESYSTTIEYVLPTNFDITRVILVAFVTKLSPNHLNDEVLNASEYSFSNLFLETHDLIDKPKIVAYPNPTSNYLELKSPVGRKEILICNLHGIKMYSEITNEEVKHLDVSKFKNGAYLLVINQETGVYREQINILH